MGDHYILFHVCSFIYPLLRTGGGAGPVLGKDGIKMSETGALLRSSMCCQRVGATNECHCSMTGMIIEACLVRSSYSMGKIQSGWVREGLIHRVRS